MTRNLIPCGKVRGSTCANIVCSAPCYYAQLSGDYPLLAHEVLIARYTLTHAFVYHTIQGAKALPG